jgi:predicted Zn-dependent peptidase
MLWVVATGRPGVDAEELESAVTEVLDQLRSSGPTEIELQGARNRARRQLVRQLDSVTRRADLLAHAAVLRGDAGYINKVFERYEQMPPDEVALSARTLLDPARRSVVHVVPDGSRGGAEDVAAAAAGEES